MLKQGTHKCRGFLQGTQESDDVLFHLVRAGNGDLADLVVFNMRPNQLVWVQIRAIRWQSEHPNALMIVSDEFFDHCGSMHRMAVNNQEDWRGSVHDEALDEFDEK